MRIARALAGLLGEALVTFGAVLLLYFGWQLWWTDVAAEADGRVAVAQLQQGFADPARLQPAQVPIGDAFAIIRVPRFGADYARPVYQGTTPAVLARGVGHYLGSSRPGEVGNFALAGHRTTYGRPFHRIADLRPGDAVLVETATTYYVYRVQVSRVVAPDEVSVLLPAPGQPGLAARAAVLTLTSCHPEFSSRERFIVHARLEAGYPRTGGLPASVLEVGR